MPAMKDFVAFYRELATQAQTMTERFEKRPNEPKDEKKEKGRQTVSKVVLNGSTFLLGSSR